jgi:hypothetical protein
MKMYAEVVWVNALLTSALNVVRGQLQAVAALSTGKRPPVNTEYEAGWAPLPIWTTWRKF